MSEYISMSYVSYIISYVLSIMCIVIIRYIVCRCMQYDEQLAGMVVVFESLCPAWRSLAATSHRHKRRRKSFKS